MLALLVNRYPRPAMRTNATYNLRCVALNCDLSKSNLYIGSVKSTFTACLHITLLLRAKVSLKSKK